MRFFISLLCLSLYGISYGDQTSKVLEANYAMLGVNGVYFIEGRDKAEKFLDKIFNDPWFKKNFKIKKPVVIKSASNSSLSANVGKDVANGRGTIAIPDRGCYNFNVIHEVAHHVAPHCQHEKEFTKMYLILLEHFANPNVAKELKTAYKRLGVQF